MVLQLFVSHRIGARLLLHIDKLNEPILERPHNRQSHMPEPIDRLDDHYIKRNHNILMRSHPYQRKEGRYNQLILLISDPYLF